MSRHQRQALLAAEWTSHRGPRKRLIGPKSKTGCATCKKRHIKCDEQRPDCTQCLRGNRICPGYRSWNDDDAWVVWQPAPAVSAITNVPFSVRFDLVDQLDEVALMSLGRFFKDIIPDLGDSIAVGMGKVCLQVLTSDPWLSSGMVAIGALQPRTALGKCTSADMSTLALTYRGRCIKGLRKGLSSTNPDQHRHTLLLCVFLCILFDVIAGNYEEALTHLEACIQGFYLHSDRSVQTLDTTVAAAFRLSDSMASAYLGMRAPSIAAPSLSTFCSLSEARHELDNIGKQIYFFMRTKADALRYRNEVGIIHSEVRVPQAKLMTILDDWHRSFSVVHDYNNESRACLASKILYHHYKVLLATCLERKEELYDEHFASFEAIITNARWFLASSEGAFSMEGVAVLPLYMTALKCRKPNLRQMAMDLLEIYDVREGVWDTTVLRTIARRVIELEANCAAAAAALTQNQLIPEPARIHSVDTTIEKGSHGLIVHADFRIRVIGETNEWADFHEVFQIPD